MNQATALVNEELLEAFYTVISDFRLGIIDDDTKKEKLLRLAERYERSLGTYAHEDQTGLF